MVSAPSDSLVLAEASYLIGTVPGPSAEAALLRSMTTRRFEVIGPTPEDLTQMAALASTYEDLPLGATLSRAEQFRTTALSTLWVGAPCLEKSPTQGVKSIMPSNDGRPFCVGTERGLGAGVVVGVEGLEPPTSSL